MDATENCETGGHDQNLTCPDCKTVTNGTTLGLCWDFKESCLRCFICGYRSYVNSRRPRTKADTVGQVGQLDQ